MKEEKSVIDCLFDENNNDDIVLMNERNEKMTFHQIAVIPLEKTTYAILEPATKMEGVNEGEGLVFEINEDENGNERLMLCTDEKMIDKVFDVYNEMVDDANKDDEDDE